jgi:hypothetical protein
MTALLQTEHVLSSWAQIEAHPSSLAASETSKLLETRLRAMSKRPPSLEKLSKISDSEKIMERLFGVSAQLKILVSQVSMHLPEDWRRQLFRKLDDLLEPENWDESDTLVNPNSFMAFLRLILQIGPVGRASLGVSAEGHFLVGWMREGDSLTLEFIGKDGVHWNIVRHIAGRRESAAGRTIVDRLKAVLQPYAPEDWFSNGNTLSS